MLLPSYTKITHRCSSRACTLIELVMVIVIVGVVGSTAAIAAVESARIYSRSLPRIEASYQVEFALGQLRADLKAIRLDDGFEQIQQSLLSIETTGGEALKYVYDRGELTRNGHLVGTGIDEFEFRYRAVDGTFTSDEEAVHLIEVDFVVVRSGERLPVYATIYPRAVTQ